MNNTYFFLLLLIICWTTNPFMKKQVATKMTSSEYMIYNHGLCSILIVGYVVYLLLNRQYSIESLKKLTSKDIGISLVAALTTVVASVLLIDLLKNNDASYIIPHVQPCIIVLTLLVGYFLFKEQITSNKIIGTGLIVAGLVFMNYKS